MPYNKKDCKHHSIKAKCCTKPGIPYSCKTTNCTHFKIKSVLTTTDLFEIDEAQAITKKSVN